MSEEEKLVVPQMVKFEVLTKIIIAYSKIGGDKEEKSYNDVAAVANVSPSNVGRNVRFLVTMGILEGSRGKYKLTPEGAKYARALDWGKINEANKYLREILQNTEIVKRILGYVSINKPVDRETLVGQIAVIANVRRTPRFETGIRGFVDMLATSGLLEEKNEKYTIGEIRERKPVTTEPSEEKLTRFPAEIEPVTSVTELKKELTFPITLNLNISDETNVENLKKILKIIKEIFSE
jgi:predicted transcriptional regulator